MDYMQSSETGILSLMLSCISLSGARTRRHLTSDDYRHIAYGVCVCVCVQRGIIVQQSLYTDDTHFLLHEIPRYNSWWKRLMTHLIQIRNN
jgi:hypothetical protein